jgi:hypothetical protein
MMMAVKRAKSSICRDHKNQTSVQVNHRRRIGKITSGDPLATANQVSRFGDLSSNPKGLRQIGPSPPLDS